MSYRDRLGQSYGQNQQFPQYPHQGQYAQNHNNMRQQYYQQQNSYPRYQGIFRVFARMFLFFFLFF